MSNETPEPKVGDIFHNNANGIPVRVMAVNEGKVYFEHAYDGANPTSLSVPMFLNAFRRPYG